MKYRVWFSTVLVILYGLFSIACYVSADDIKSRIKQRLPTIIMLKSKGIVGENNMGYLQFIGNSMEKQDVVKAENSDRQKVYKAIAKQQGTTVEKVGKRRAMQIAKKAKTGEWLQNADGKWYQNN